MKFFSPEKRARLRPRRGTAKDRGYAGAEWESVRKKVLIRDAYQCRHCGRVCGEKREAHIDHIIPKRILDSNDINGLQVLCSRCHSKKTQMERRCDGLT